MLTKIIRIIAVLFAVIAAATVLPQLYYTTFPRKAEVVIKTSVTAKYSAILLSPNIFIPPIRNKPQDKLSVTTVMAKATPAILSPGSFCSIMFPS